MYKYTIEAWNIKDTSCGWRVLEITDSINITLKALTEEEAIEKAKVIAKRDKYEITSSKDSTTSCSRV